MIKTLHASHWLIGAVCFCAGLILLSREFIPTGFVQRALVTEVEEQYFEANDAIPAGWAQTLTLQLPNQGPVLTSHAGAEYQPLQEAQRLTPGDEVLVSHSQESGTLLLDRYRLPGVAVLFGIFVAVVVALTGKQGIFALGGMTLTFATLLGVLLPWLLSGGDPVLATSVWAICMAVTTIYLSHGWNRTSHLALLSLLAVLALVGLLSQAAVASLGLSGFGSEEAMFLQVGANTVSLQGFFLAGVLLGVLGVLDDICLAQVAVVEELAAAKPDIEIRELWQRSMRVGRTHVVSLVNTLVLAYASANLPLFLLFIMNQAQLPWWAALNSELITEEVVRTLAGSIGVVLAVPVSSALAAFGLKHWSEIMPGTPKSHHKHSHHHLH